MTVIMTSPDVTSWQEQELLDGDKIIFIPFFTRICGIRCDMMFIELSNNYCYNLTEKEIWELQDWFISDCRWVSHNNVIFLENSCIK